MEIYFKSNKMQKVCNSAEECAKKWGGPIAKKVQQRLAELKAADALSDISYLPPPRLHELVGDRKGQFAVDLAQPFRLTFEPDHNPVPQKENGGVDWTKITRIKIIAVEDYH